MKKRSWQTPTWRGVASLQEYFHSDCVSEGEGEGGGEGAAARPRVRRPTAPGTARRALRCASGFCERRERTDAHTGYYRSVRGGLSSKRASKPSGRAGGHNCLGERGMASVCDVREGTRCPRTRLRLPAGGSAESPKAPPPRELRMRPRSNEPPRARRREPRHAEQHETRPRANPIIFFSLPNVFSLLFGTTEHTTRATKLNTSSVHAGQSHRIPRPGSLISISVSATEPGIRFCTVPR